jgi:hypothetical protein
MRLGNRIIRRSIHDGLLSGPDIDVSIIVDHDDPAIWVGSGP